MAFVEVSGLAKSYRRAADEVTVLHGLSLEVESGQPEPGELAMATCMRLSPAPVLMNEPVLVIVDPPPTNVPPSTEKAPPARIATAPETNSTPVLAKN